MPRILSLIGLVGLPALCTAPVSGAITLFASDPFAGSTALTTPGRQAVALNELFLPSFDTEVDVFALDDAFFDVNPPVNFFNGLASALPVGGLNLIVLQDIDTDNNPATPFNAIAAADLIAAEIDQPGAGFYVYWNSVLNVNRLVYSTDLSDNTADISILARITDLAGQDAIDELPRFSEGNFQIVPAPSAAGAIGLIAFAGLRRRRVASR